jgi:hypothetical protein
MSGETLNLVTLIAHSTNECEFFKWFVLFGVFSPLRMDIFVLFFFV